jgi:hypothetical protein
LAAASIDLSRILNLQLSPIFATLALFPPHLLILYFWFFLASLTYPPEIQAQADWSRGNTRLLSLSTTRRHHPSADSENRQLIATNFGAITAAKTASASITEAIYQLTIRP